MPKKPTAITLWLKEDSKVPTSAYCRICPHCKKCMEKRKIIQYTGTLAEKCDNPNILTAEDWIIGEYNRLVKAGRAVKIERKQSGITKFIRLIDIEFVYPYGGKLGIYSERKSYAKSK